MNSNLHLLGFPGGFSWVPLMPANYHPGEMKICKLNPKPWAGSGSGTEFHCVHETNPQADRLESFHKVGV